MAATAVPVSAHEVSVAAADSPVSGSELIGGLELPSDLECNWWCLCCGPLLAALLHELGAYSPDQLLDHLRAFCDLVVPTFGPRTSKASIQPLLSPDGSPFEPL